MTSGGLLEGFVDFLTQLEVGPGFESELGAKVREFGGLAVGGQLLEERGRELLLAFVWPTPPTRETDRPTETAGRMPARKASVSKMSWPSVMDMMAVGSGAVMSLLGVSTTGIEARVAPFLARRPARSSKDLSGRRTCHPG
jgi:hypothetical protein